MLAVAVVMFETVALILEHVERLVFDTPPGSTRSCDIKNIFTAHLRTGCLSENALFAVFALLAMIFGMLDPTILGHGGYDGYESLSRLQALSVATT